MKSADQHTISILLPDLGGGGAERVHVHLANDWAMRGLRVEFVLQVRRGELLAALDERVTVVDLAAPRARSLLLPLTAYIRRVRPAVMLAAMWPLTSICVLAWRLANRGGKLFVSDHTQLSVSAPHEIHLPVRLIGAVIRHTYRFASGVIAVSKGVRDDLCRLGSLDSRLIKVIYNPTAVGVPDQPASFEQRQALWGGSAGTHILSVGTLKRQKDHANLISAFALLPRELNARLTILGEGHMRSELEDLIKSLNLADRVKLPGFAIDPYLWYRTADLFVLSSRWEGFGNVIVEALECGIPVVSTDCPTGPAEILDDGRYGRLVPVQDPHAMAAAILEALAEPADAVLLRRRARDFLVSTVSDEYLRYLGVEAS